MSNADKLFYELGYKKDIGEPYGIIRYKHIQEDYYIRFYLEDKEFDSNKIIENEIYPLEINIPLLKTINEKVKELRMV